MKNVILIFLGLFPCISVSAKVVINDIFAGNADMIHTDHLRLSTWVELYNKGDSRGSPLGYHLASKVTIPSAWQLPAISKYRFYRGFHYQA